MRGALGDSGIEVRALGMGCWAIGGAFWAGETPQGKLHLSMPTNHELNLPSD
jgi:aryl-alcohol dehydrogenase-like predicted oxidoreductase